MDNKPDLTKDFFDLMFLVQDNMRSIVRGKDSNLSPVQILILRTLFSTGEIAQNELGTLLGRDKSQIARLIKDLHVKGIILRRPSPIDGRVTLIQAAEHVRTSIETFSQFEAELVKAILSGASPEEVRVFTALIHRMGQNLKAGAP